MVDVGVSSEQATRNKSVSTWKMADDVRLSFGVYGDSPQEPIVMEVDGRYVSVMLDKFGEDMDLYPVADGPGESLCASSSQPAVLRLALSARH